MQNIDSKNIVTLQAPEKYINGKAWVNKLVSDAAAGCTVSSATFEAGSRTHWHQHPTVQILIAEKGNGFVQKKGEPKHLMQPGDVAIIFADEEHWHGAAADSMFSHIAIQLVKDDAIIINRVSDEEYNK